MSRIAAWMRAACRTVRQRAAPVGIAWWSTLRAWASRAGRRLRTVGPRCRAGTLRVPLGTRLLLVLVAVAAMSTTFCVLLQDSRLSADLRVACEAHVRRAAQMASQLLDERLVAQSVRYRALAASPQVLANVEAGHQPTLVYFAEQLLPVHRAAAILFLDNSGGVVAGAGSPELREAVQRTAASASGPDGRRGPADASGARLLDCAGELFTVVRVPIGEGAEAAGSLVSVEAIDAGVLARWSRLCQARLSAGARGEPEPMSAVVRTIGPLQLQVSTRSGEEAEALNNSRDNLLAGGMLGLAVALAASLMLARHVVRPIRAIQRATERIGAGQLDVRLDQGRNDEVGDVARSFNLMLDSLQRNMRERSRVESQASHLAFHDTLTGLPNRRMLKQRLKTAIDRAQARQSQLALLFLDLDRFKNVNDTLGHSAGDSLLLAVACRLHSCLESFAGKTPEQEVEALLARLGGDEFTMLLPDVENREQVAALADKILVALSMPFDVVGHEVSVSASLGIALAPDDGRDVETLLRDSDMAMFHAKGRGGRGYEFYADSMEEIAAKRLALESKLRRALEAGEFQLVYQPKLDLETNTITGLEALLRWRTADGQSIPPEEFVPIAEETGIIVAIGEWVLRTAINQGLAWQREGLRPVRISVNVSARQMDSREDFVGLLDRVLRETGVDPSLVELEITESSLLNDEDEAVVLLQRVRALGVGLSLDDFGTGYSSLSYLRLLPIDTLKIDRSFIQGADDNPADVALVGSIVTMAKVLGLRVIVEGVETRKQRRFLEQLGCDEIQGFLISRPVDAVAAAALLRRSPRPPRRSVMLRGMRGRRG